MMPFIEYVPFYASFDKIVRFLHVHADTFEFKCRIRLIWPSPKLLNT